MNKSINMDLYTLGEVKDELLGPEGTPERNEYENQVKEALDAYYVGEAIRKARLIQNLSQEELGERVGVKRSQICKLESGKCSPTISTISRVFRALGINSATLELGGVGKVSLW